MTAITANVAVLFFAAASAYAGVADVATMKISNRLVLAMLAAYAVFAPVSGMGYDVIAVNAIVAVIVLVCAIAMFEFGWIGGGDGKLAAVSVLWLGYDLLMPYLFYTAVFGGVFATILIALRSVPLPAAIQGWPWLSRLHSKETGIPYGVALALGNLMLLPQAPWFGKII